eukprot:763748_1
MSKQSQTNRRFTEEDLMCFDPARKNKNTFKFKSIDISTALHLEEELIKILRRLHTRIKAKGYTHEELELICKGTQYSAFSTALQLTVTDLMIKKSKTIEPAYFSRWLI